MREVLFLYVHLSNFLTHSLEGTRPMVLTRKLWRCDAGLCLLTVGLEVEPFKKGLAEDGAVVIRIPHVANAT